MKKPPDNPHVLLPYQQKWIGDQSEVRVIEKSRRIGISWATGAESVVDASEEDGRNTWYITYNKESSKEYILDCAWWAKKLSVVCSDIDEQEILDGDEGKAILTYTIHFASGYRISALSSRPTNLRNKKGHIIIDEAAFIENLSELLKAALAVLMWGGKVSIISTHNGVDNEFNKLVQEIRANKKPYSLHRVTVDDAIEQGLVKRIAMVNGTKYTAKTDKETRAKWFAFYGDDADEELRVIPAASGGTYISRAIAQRAMRDGPVYRLELPPSFVALPEAEREAFIKDWLEILQPSLDALPKDRHHCFGQDFGRKADRSVITPAYLTQDLRVRCPFAIEMLEVPYESQKQILFHIVDALPKFFAGAIDATGNGAYLAEVAMQRYGAITDESSGGIACVSLSQGWYALNLPILRAAFQNEEIEIVRDDDHLTDLAAFKEIEGNPTLPKVKTKSTLKDGKGKKAKPRHGDAAIAYLLMNFASKMPLVEYGYTPAKRGPNKAGFTRKKRGVM